MLLERSWTSIFHYFGVTVPAFLCSSTLQGTAFFTPPNWGGGFNYTFGRCLAHSETLSVRLFPPKLGGVILHYFRQSTWRCSNSPRKNRESFPLSENVFLVLVTDASVGRVLGGAQIVPEKNARVFSCLRMFVGVGYECFCWQSMFLPPC